MCYILEAKDLLTSIFRSGVSETDTYQIGIIKESIERNFENVYVDVTRHTLVFDSQEDEAFNIDGQRLWPNPNAWQRIDHAFTSTYFMYEFPLELKTKLNQHIAEIVNVRNS